MTARPHRGSHLAKRLSCQRIDALLNVEGLLANALTNLVLGIPASTSHRDMTGYPHA